MPWAYTMSAGAFFGTMSVTIGRWMVFVVEAMRILRSRGGVRWRFVKAAVSLVEASSSSDTGAMPDIADGPYRTARSTVAQARWRDWRTILFFAAVVAGMWLLCLSVRTTFACDREAGRCSLQRHTVLGTTERVIPLASVTGAALAAFSDPRCRPGLERECPLDIHLSTTAGEIRLPSAGSDVELSAFSRAVNQFVWTPDEPTLAVAYGSVWRRCEGYAPIFVLLLVGCLFIRPGVRVTSDRAQRLVFEIRALGPVLARKRTYDLATVQAATVLTARSRRRRYSRASVQLVMRDASRVDVPVSGGSPRGCQAIADKINEVLGRPPS
jgi:hypothetical protein